MRLTVSFWHVPFWKSSRSKPPDVGVQVPTNLRTDPSVETSQFADHLNSRGVAGSLPLGVDLSVQPSRQLLVSRLGHGRAIHSAIPSLTWLFAQR